MSEFSNDGPEPDDLTDLLTRQEESGTEDFLRNLRRRIHRRSVTAQVATFTWELPQPVLLELLHLTKEVFVALASRKENRP
jgi:hypothetical protein